RRQNGDWVTPDEVEIISEGATRRAKLKKTGEPLVIGDVEKMSKSKKNVVAPADMAERYGVDAARICVLSDSPPERDVQWTAAGIEGAWRLVNRIWSEFDTDLAGGGPSEFDDPRAEALRRTTHRTIKQVTDAIEGWRFNSAIARLHEFVAAIKSFPPAGASAE